MRFWLVVIRCFILGAILFLFVMMASPWYSWSFLRWFVSVFFYRVCRECCLLSLSFICLRSYSAHFPYSSKAHYSRVCWWTNCLSRLTMFVWHYSRCNLSSATFEKLMSCTVCLYYQLLVIQNAVSSLFYISPCVFDTLRLVLAKSRHPSVLRVTPRDVVMTASCLACRGHKVAEAIFLRPLP